MDFNTPDWLQMHSRERVSELEEQLRAARQETARLEENLIKCQASEDALKRMLGERGGAAAVGGGDIQRQMLQLRVISQARESRAEAERAAEIEEQLQNEFRCVQVLLLLL